VSARGFLCHPLLASRALAHGFGQRGCPAPPGLRRPRQVHGGRAVRLSRPDAPLGEADAVLSTLPGVPVGVVTADCVPVLMASGGGGAVAAVHAGWRGLAAGVLPAALAALRRIAAERGATPAPLWAVLGPHIGPCCYEVDAAVWEALRPRFGAVLTQALRPGRPGHAQLDLGALARAALRAAGVEEHNLSALPDACTRCHGERFHSYRRDGARAGRLLHWIAAGEGQLAKAAPRG